MDLTKKLKTMIGGLPRVGAVLDRLLAVFAPPETIFQVLDITLGDEGHSRLASTHLLLL